MQGLVRKCATGVGGPPQPRAAPGFSRTRRQGSAGAPVIVVDASAVLEVLLNTAAGTRIAARFFAIGTSLHAPHLLDLEVVSVLRHYLRAGDLDEERAEQALRDYLDLRPAALRARALLATHLGASLPLDRLRRRLYRARRGPVGTPDHARPAPGVHQRPQRPHRNRLRLFTTPPQRARAPGLLRRRRGLRRPPERGSCAPW